MDIVTALGVSGGLAFIFLAIIISIKECVKDIIKTYYDYKHKQDRADIKDNN